ncbi:MAG TPA: methyltransferase domain-containing protein [Methylomirabilota bacterium]|nr:methyltransferase domain-containing protein [Methylomirabilota bacterium]
MDLADVKRLYDDWGASDALWAILPFTGKRGNRWNVGEFFQTGVREIEGLLHSIRALGLPLRQGTALDFGCGVGRLSQALAQHFDTVWGVDIAPSMIERAQAYNRFGTRCRYVLNTRDDLAVLGGPRFDLVYSNITLQHLEPRYARGYIAEFLRVAARPGLVVFHQPSEHRLPAAATRSAREALKRVVPSPLLAAYRRLRGMVLREPRWEMHAIPRDEVTRLIEAHGGRLAHVADEYNSRSGWHSCTYFVTT